MGGSISNKKSENKLYIDCFQVKRASLVDSRTSVTDVKFGPHHLGLQLV